ncbi:hypothetical protein Emed_003727 [Eimeria media]
MRGLFSARRLALLAFGLLLARGNVDAEEVHDTSESNEQKQPAGQQPPKASSDEAFAQDIEGLLNLLRPPQDFDESAGAEDVPQDMHASSAEEAEELNTVWDNETWLLDSYRGPPQLTPVRLPETRDSSSHATADDFLEEEELGEGEALSHARPLFSSHIQENGHSILEVTRETDLTFLGEDKDVHKGIYEMAGKCGGVFLSPNIPGFNSKKVCLWRHWSERFHHAHPTLKGAVEQGAFPIPNVLKLTFALPSALYRMGKALVAPPSTLTSLAWLVVRKTTNEIRKQQAKGEEVNVGRALNEVLRQEKELQEPLRTAFFLVSGLGCKADVPYTDRAREGFAAFSPDMRSCPQSPLLQHLADNPQESLAWVPPGLPSRLTVKIAKELPPEQQHEQWRLPLYRLWHLLWFQIFEAYRLDHLWNWMKKLDTTKLFPGWEVKAVGSALFTEHRPAAYADGSWRFAHIDPKTLELARHPNGRLRGFGRASASNNSINNNAMNDSLNHRTSVPDGNEGLSGFIPGDNREESSEEDDCIETEVVKDATSVSYIRCGKVLKIHKSKCGTVPTFDYVNQSPYAVLLSPSSETRRSAKKRKFTEGTDQQGEIDTEELRKHGWTIADAVWAFRPTTGTKLLMDAVYMLPSDKKDVCAYVWLWAVNTVASPLRKEPLLSRHPEARMHRGYRAFFHLTVKGLIDDFIAATAGIASVYFAREMKRRGLGRHLRVMCVSFGAPSWGTPQMYGSFDRLGIIWNEIWTAHDPIPELLAGEDILGLAYDRRQIILHGHDWGDVQLDSPFAFDGRAWVKGTEESRAWKQVLFWLFNLHQLSTLPLHPKIAHQHGYSAALSLISGAYKWMSHLAVPWIPLPKMEITTFPEMMQILAAVHAERLKATQETEPSALGLEASATSNTAD